MKHVLASRQVHLDFHTSEHIPGIGAEFNPEEFADMVGAADINSMTVFARCHHGWLYYPSEKNPELIHPHLKRRNLMVEQVRALHARGIKAPVYTTVQWDYQSANNHPEWLMRRADGSHLGDPFTEPGFYHSLCVNTGYTGFLKRHIRELCELLGEELDGVFLDIVQVHPCYCSECRRKMRAEGIDIGREDQVYAYAESVMNNFKQEMTEWIHSFNPAVTVFYNGSHLDPSTKKSQDAYTHFEAESLPSGFWGYLHFPVTGRYIRTLGKDCLGMTGKFHTEWGDFHSLKNQAALEYECFRMLSMGFACSIGDQLEPYGKLNPTTYRLIGSVFSQYKKYEPWARPANPLTEAALLTYEDHESEIQIPECIMGAVQMLQEIALQFDIIDADMNFDSYKLLILPERLRMSEEQQQRLETYIAGGGKVLALAQGGLSETDEFPQAFGIHYEGKQEVYPDFIVPEGDMAEGLEVENEYVIYMQGEKISLHEAGCLTGARAPYFKRSAEKFCSHRYTPSAKGELYPAAVQNGNIIYFTHPLFEQYRKNAPVWCKKLVKNAISLLLKDVYVRHNGPSTLEVNLLQQEAERRINVHILSYIPVRKSVDIDIIEERTRLYNIEFEFNLPETILSAKCVGSEEALKVQDGKVTIPFIDGYEVLELKY